MMLFWIAVGAAAILALLWMVRPFLRSLSLERDETDSALSVYRDQVDELERDVDAGLISPAEFDAAQEEIEARALGAARTLDNGLVVSRRSPGVAAGLFVIAAAGSLGLYLTLGAPTSPDQPLAARKAAAMTRQANAGDMSDRIAALIEKTRAGSRSFEDWWLLARSYAATGDHASAADAYRTAAELSGDRPAVLAAYAESLTLANGNKVPQAARLVFEQVLQKTPDPRSRYYVALSKAQAQQFEAAIEDWAALARDSAPDAPWMPLVRRDIANMARFLNRDVQAYLPDATQDEIARAGGGEIAEPAALQARATALEAALEAEPKDYKGWIELAEVQSARSEDEMAAAALSKARTHFAAAPFVLAKIDAAARNLGLDVLDAPASASRGPDADDIAAAASMTDADRASMIEGMVAGLAARLDENPDDPEGWIMLIRSYAVLGETAKAREAYGTAVQHFGDNAAVLARLQADAGALATP